MKLRMYLRGLGLGMIITAILLTFAVKPADSKAMTDEDVKKRAAELGMVEESSTLVQPASIPEKKEDTNKVLSEPKEPVAEEIKTEEPKVEEPKEEEKKEEPKAEEPKEEEKKEEPKAEEPKEEKKEEPKVEEPKEEEKKEEPKVEEPKEEKKEEPKAEEPKKEEKKEEPKVEEPKKKSTTTITVAGGSSSDVVAKLLEKGGVVDSASKFDAYLCNNGYDKRIAAGSHVIPADADYHTIAEILTSR